MAQDQSLRDQLKNHNRDFRGRSYPQPQSATHYSSYTSRSTNRFETPANMESMSQPLLQNFNPSIKPTNHAMWPFPHTGVQNSDSSMIETGDELAYSHGHFWGDSANCGGAVSWDNNLHREPYIMPDFDGSFGMKPQFNYNHTATKNSLNNGSVNYCGQPLLMPSGTQRVLQGPGTNKSGSESSNSNSPKSYLSDFLESEISLFSPGLVSDQATSASQWNYYHTPNLDTKASPTSSLLSPFSTPNSALQNAQDSVSNNYTGLPRTLSSFSVYPTDSTNASQPSNLSMMSYGGMQTNLPSSSGPYDSDPVSTSWYLPGYSHNISRLPNMQAQPPRGGTLRSMETEETSLSSQYNFSAAAQDNLPDRMRIPGSGTTQSQRKFNDQILIQGKKNGLTYKDIREKMLGEKPAESTLRGRYRSLTKAKKDRVRKPVWKTRDIELLNEFVEQEFDRIESTFPNPRSFNLQQKLNKVAWKKVADFIHCQGGSYQFGNSTCKRKWLELHSS